MLLVIPGNSPLFIGLNKKWSFFDKNFKKMKEKEKKKWPLIVPFLAQYNNNSQFFAHFAQKQIFGPGQKRLK